MPWSLKIPLIINILAILVALYFLVTDAFRQTSSSNGMLLVMTLGLIGYVGLCYYLFLQGHLKLATTLAWIPAFPLAGYGLIVLIIIIGKPDFR